MANVFEEWLERYFDEEDPKAFYRAIFPSGELEEKGKYVEGQYTAIALCISTTEKRPKKRIKKNPDGSIERVQLYNEDGTPKMEPKVYRFTMTDDLGLIDKLTRRDDLFCLMSPLSYAGKARTAENARFMYAMAFDLDHIRQKEDGTPIGLMNLWNGHIERAGRLPRPTYIVSSGNGLHLYYVLKQPVPLFQNIVGQLQKLKHELTWMIWNEGIVDIKNEADIQQEGIFQGFRIPGTITKNTEKDGSRARAFLTGEKVTIEDLNSFVDEKYRVTEFKYKSKLLKKKAKELYPEWYDARITKGKKGVLKPWRVSRRLYDWWKREILKKASVGHRYYCLMILAILAKKCSFLDVDHVDPETGKMKKGKNPNPVTFEELETDAFEIMHHFEELTEKEDNHFTESDVLDALDAFEDWGLLTFPRNSISYRAGFVLPVTERKGRKQKDHIKLMNFIRDEINGHRDTWRNKDGRPKKAQLVAEWRELHPAGRKIDCERELHLSRPTVLKWWNYKEIQ